jgi:hypothetical protein
LELAIAPVEPTEEQFLIFNALDTLALIQIHFYDANQGYWYIQTPSPILAISVIAPAGEIFPLNFIQTDDDP